MGAKKGRTSQLDDILGPKMETRATCVPNEFKLCSTSDHHPVYVSIQEDDRQGHFIQHKNKVDGQDGSRLTKMKKSNAKRM